MAMSEDDFRARLDRLDAKLDRLDAKLDAQRIELQTNSNDAHDKINEQIQALQTEAAENRHIIKAMDAHIAAEKPFEVSWQEKVYRVVIYILTSGVGAFVAIFVSRWLRQ